MKQVVTLLFVVIAVACGAPAGDSQFAPEWVNANARIYTLRDAIRTAASAIKSKQARFSNPEIDWDRAEVLTTEFNAVFNTSMEAIAKIGLETNSTAGQEIADIALEAGNEIDSILTEMIKDIKNQTLDGEGAYEYIGQSELWFLASSLRIRKYYRDVGEDVEKKIRKVYSDSYPKREEIVNELSEIFGYPRAA